MTARQAPPTVVCTDLDRTLIYSADALDLPGPDSEAPELLCVEVYRGRPLSFVTTAAAAVWAELGMRAVVVPTTTRTPEQLGRIRQPGGPPRYAIAGNGGRLLVDGVPDPDWDEQVRARLAACTPVARVVAHLESRRDDFVSAVRVAGDQFVYLVVDRAAVPAGWVGELERWCAAGGWRVSLQGRKIYAVPDPLTKSAAAREVVRRCGGGPLLAAGDSLLDADLLTVADAAIRPAHGELADRGFRLDHLDVTARTGVLAGEDVVSWFGERVGGGTSDSGRLDLTIPSIRGASPWPCGTN